MAWSLCFPKSIKIAYSSVGGVETPVPSSPISRKSSSSHLAVRCLCFGGRVSTKKLEVQLKQRVKAFEKHVDLSEAQSKHLDWAYERNKGYWDKRASECEGFAKDSNDQAQEQMAQAVQLAYQIAAVRSGPEASYDRVRQEACVLLQDIREKILIWEKGLCWRQEQQPEPAPTSKAAERKERRDSFYKSQLEFVKLLKDKLPTTEPLA